MKSVQSIVKPTWPKLALLTLVLGWQLPIFAAPSVRVQRMIQLGQYANASSTIRTQLEANPEDLELHAVAGIVLSRAARHGDALPHFDLSEGTRFYEMEGVYAHADTIRELGDPVAAARLRQQRLTDPQLDDGRELIVRLGLVDDYIRSGDFDMAYEQLISLHSLWPRSPSLHGHMADFYFEMGDLASAEFHLWYVTDFLGLRLSMRGMFTQVRIYLDDRDYGAAQAVLDNAMRLNRKNLRLWARQAELYRLQGDPGHAADLLGSQRFGFQDHPEMGAVEALSLYQSGQRVEAQQVMEWMTDLYVDHPALEALSVISEGEH